MLEVRGPVVLQSMLLAEHGGAAEHAANCVIVYAYTHTRTRARTRG